MSGIDQARPGPTGAARQQAAETASESATKVTPIGRTRGRRAVTRNRLLDACASLVLERGFGGVSMTAVAEQAGITRQTAYRYFSNSREVMAATLFRAGREILEAQSLVLREPGEPAELIVEYVVTGLRLVKQNALLQRAYASRDYPQAMLAAALDPAMIGRALEAMDPLARRVGWDEREQRECFEVIIRFVMSCLTLPLKPEQEAGLRDALRRRLLPALGLAPSPVSA